MKVKFKNGTREYIMKVKEELKNGDVILIDGSTVEKDQVLERIKEKVVKK
jgi:GTP-dependent phosphoenolpyruvate carboxykinase